MEVSGCDEVDSTGSKDTPGKDSDLKNSEDVSVEADYKSDDYFDEYDYYCPVPEYDDEMFLPCEEPMSPSEKLPEKPATPIEDTVQAGENISVGFPQNQLILGESSLSVKQEDIGERKYILNREVVKDSGDLTGETPHVNIAKEETPEDISDTLNTEDIQEIGETLCLNTAKEETPEEISDTFRREELGETDDRREGTSQETLSHNRADESTKVTDVSETVRPVEEVSDPETPVGTNEDAPKFDRDQLDKIWLLAKKLCKARCAYNQNVCRPLMAVNRKLPPKKRKHAETLIAQCRRNRRPDTKTNGGVCTIGKGDDSQYEDPPEWNWGQPLPEKLCEAIPSKPVPNTPTITLDDESPVSSPQWYEKTSPPHPKRTKALSPASKSLKISISVTRFNNSGNTTVILSDSDEELPNFSMELGISPRKTGPRSPERFDVTSDDTSCTVIHSTAPRQLAPTTRLTVRKRRRMTENRAPSGPSHRNVNPDEIVVLGSSDDSDDPDLEVLQVSKKPAPSQDPQKPTPNPTPKTDEKESKHEWCCPICLESKDKVANIMSTTCGHIFCGPCLQSTIKINKQCPNCRKKLTLRQIHNLYL